MAAPPRSVKPNSQAVPQSRSFLHTFSLCNLFTSFLLAFLWIPVCLEVSGLITSVTSGLITSVKETVQRWLNLQPDFFSATSVALVVLGLAIYFIIARRHIVYLVDFSCYRPTSFDRVPYAAFMEHSKLSGNFVEKTLQFQEFIMERSGIGERTALPIALRHLPPRPNLAAARNEFEMVVFGSLDELFDKTNVQPQEISILIVNCSLFAPVSSLCAMIINKYKMRGDIKCYNLSGMGCSAGVISIGLAKDLLQVHHNCYALVVSTENITDNWYVGNRRSMLIPNCLFRMGAATILLSNRLQDARRSKYQLLNVVRTHKGADDKAYGCVYHQQDEEGKHGVSLSKELMVIAGDALKSNITTLGPLVLPFSEQLAYLAALIIKFFNPKMKPYIPDFKRAFDHFCIHAGGRAVIDEIEKSLRLFPEHVEASRMTLHRFGNTSSSSIWYELAYTEAKRRVKPRHRVWQIAFGSGFKCNSAVWMALQSVRRTDKNPWSNTIDDYPVTIAHSSRND